MKESRTWLICAAIAVLTLILFWPLSHSDFLVYDDPAYISRNPHIQEGLNWSSVAWAFQSNEHALWYPLGRLSHLLDWTLFGNDAGKHHLTNVVLHSINSVLLFLLWRMLTGAFWRSALLAFLFALHPLRVESVAWVTERKDVLSGLFFILTLWAYARYAGVQSLKLKTPNATSAAREKKKNRKSEVSNAPNENVKGSTFYYWLALILFALGLMAKPMLVTVPFVLLLLDFWPLNRIPSLKFKAQSPPPSTDAGTTANFSRLLIEKIPFLILSIVVSVVTTLAHKKVQGIVSGEAFSFPYRLAKSAVAYFHYLQSFFWPTNLAIPYPTPDRWPVGQVILAVIVLVAISGLVIRFWRRNAILFFGWLWYLGMLIPVIGLVGIGDQAYADRYTYLPMIGFCAGLIWGLSDLAAKRPILQMIFKGVAGAALLGFMYATSVQLHYWKNSETLFAHSVAVTENNSTAENNLALYFVQNGQPAKSVEHALAALKISPGYAAPHEHLAIAYFNLGQLDKANAECAIALLDQPNNPELHNCFGAVLAQLGKVEAGCNEFAKSIELNPSQPLTQRNWGVALDLLGKYSEAIAHFQESLRLKPDEAETYFKLALTLEHAGKVQDAAQFYQKCLQLQPDHTAAKVRLSELQRKTPN